MTGLTARTLLSAAIAGSMALAGVLAGAAGAQASDDRWEQGRWEQGHWERGQWERDHHHRAPDHHVHVVQERYVEAPPRVVYQRPVMVVPAPLYQAPAYAPPAEPSLNFNLTIPLR